MRVLGTSRTPKRIVGVTQVGLDELLERSDALIVCADRNPSTESLFSEEKLKRMKQSAILVSIVGGIVDEEALARLLQEGGLAGAGLDVPRRDSPLAGCANAVLTSHIGWYTADARERLASIIVENVRAYLAGRPQNVVNP